MEKINIAELLKDCPKGMELDCTIFNGKVYFEGIDDNNSAYPIKISVNLVNIEHLDIYGQYNTRDYAKCVIFPKGKTSWEGFVSPCKFKDGDVCYVKTKELFEYIFIFKVSENYDCITNYVTLSAYDLYIEDISSVCATDSIKEIRLATEEEKEKLFKAIKANGYKWNEETKTLEKLPKFKVGNRVRSKINQCKYKIIDIRKDVYIMNYANDKLAYHVPFCDEDNFSLVPNKFDITNLKPYESRVLVRGDIYNFWKPAIFGFIKDKIFYILGGAAYEQCIPYKNNEHLLGTKNDCDEYYKTW